MTVKQIKDEVLYSLRRRATDKEVEEILEFVEDNPEASLDEIILDYYSC